MLGVVLVRLGCHYEIDWVASTTDVYFSQCWRLGIQDHCARRFDSRGWTFSGLPSLCVLTWQRERERASELLSPFIRTLI